METWLLNLHTMILDGFVLTLDDVIQLYALKASVALIID